MTLIEMTVVILVLLLLVSILVVGTTAWKKGSDRSGCLMNIRNVQQAVRSYQNMDNLPAGQAIDVDAIAVRFGLTNVGTCPGGGAYSRVATIPALGTLSMSCSLATSEGHQPEEYSGW